MLLAVAGTSQAAHLFSNTAGHTTLDQVLTGGAKYSNLSVEDVDREHLVRDGASENSAAIPTAQAGREQRRRSLTYFGQLTDFQIPDEETPARVEFADHGASSAWRPQEAFAPFVVDYSIRQMNLFADASPVTQGDGARAPMDFALLTGDQADSQQRNETIWVRELIEGGRPLNFNSGSTDPNDYDPIAHPSCATFPPNSANRAEALRYTGVQDYDDYDEGPNPYYYDPDDVRGSWATAGWPTYTGLMDRAQQLTITPAGLDVPSYVTNGNHDTLVQGNEDAIEAYENIATGCQKVLAVSQAPNSGLADPDLLLLPPTNSMLVPPDPMRRYVDKPQVKQVYGENDEDNDHGFGFVDEDENADSNGSASYYGWDPPEAPGFRFVSIDTVAEGGVVEETSSGNIDDPQFAWLERELQFASQQNKLIVIFGHHPVRSLTADVADESATVCTTKHTHGDTPEHDRNPGCDLDPRASTGEGPRAGQGPHLGRDPVAGDPRESFVELLDRFPHVLAYVAGHTHDNNVEPFPRTSGGVWWGIETSATADWPMQHRLVEVMDNQDGTLSIFGTLLDAAAPAEAPPPGSAASFDAAQLASIGRVFGYNDPQAGAGTGEGAPNDQNVELLVDDPRPPSGYPRPAGATRSRVPLAIAYEECGDNETPNRSHGPALEFPSCNPATPASDHLTVGTTDANGKTPQSVGSFAASVVCNPPAPNTVPPCSAAGDQADVRFDFTFSDVRNAGSLSDYTGELEATTILRITDKHNASTPGGDPNEAATVVDFPFPVPVQCAPTPETEGDIGSNCDLQTFAEVLVPGAVPEGKRAIWEMSATEVFDGGADGDVQTADNTPFARQGIFIP